LTVFAKSEQGMLVPIFICQKNIDLCSFFIYNNSAFKKCIVIEKVLYKTYGDQNYEKIYFLERERTSCRLRKEFL